MAFYQVVAPKCAMFTPALEHLTTMRDQVKSLRSTNDLGVKLESAFDHAVHRKLVTNTPPRAIALLTMTEVTHLDVETLLSTELSDLAQLTHRITFLFFQIDV